ncbi:hypothetical protein HK098_002539 [Nowakowskiella sp. JEL0407]|nr:hypothetical protein HK098_002539 [Nowakowskiella sp. JEL0407]
MASVYPVQCYSLANEECAYSLTDGRPWRLNLLAASRQDSSLFFVADCGTINCHRFPPSAIGGNSYLPDDFSIQAPFKKLKTNTNNDPETDSPFPINALRTGYLGNDEVLVSVDDGANVFIAYTNDLERTPITLAVTDSAWGIAIHGSSHRLAISSNAHTITLFNLSDLTSREAERVLSGHTNNIPSIDFSSRGDFIASASIDFTCRIWKVESGEQVFCRQISDQWGWCVRFLSPLAVLNLYVDENLLKTAKKMDLKDLRSLKSYNPFLSNAVTSDKLAIQFINEHPQKIDFSNRCIRLPEFIPRCLNFPPGSAEVDDLIVTFDSVEDSEADDESSNFDEYLSAQNTTQQRTPIEYSQQLSAYFKYLCVDVLSEFIFEDLVHWANTSALASQSAPDFPHYTDQEESVSSSSDGLHALNEEEESFMDVDDSENFYEESSFYSADEFDGMNENSEQNSESSTYSDAMDHIQSRDLEPDSQNVLVAHSHITDAAIGLNDDDEEEDGMIVNTSKIPSRAEPKIESIANNNTPLENLREFLIFSNPKNFYVLDSDLKELWQEQDIISREDQNRRASTRYFDRICMIEVIDELGLAVVASQRGKIALVRLLR